MVRNLTPSVNGGNGTAMNLFDVYEVDQGRGIFQIDANFGTPAAIIEMLVYSRPGHVELLPALPAAWAASSSTRRPWRDAKWFIGSISQGTPA